MWKLGGNLTANGGPPPALRCRGLAYNLAGRTVLHGVDLDVRSGESIAVTGPSGSGKTTLLHLLAGLLRPSAGMVELGGRRVDDLGESASASARREGVGMVFQFGELLDELTVAENVALPLLLNGRRDRRRVEAVLEQVELADLSAARTTELSGGQMQRVAIARALVADPAVILADEPTGALDEALSVVIGDLLVDQAREAGAGLVVVTHDPLVRDRMDRTLRISLGGLVPVLP